MLIERKSFKDIDRATYNPRVELRPGDAEYVELEKSLNQFGCVVPLVLNRRTNRVVGGHQRMTVMENNGITEADFSVVDLDEIREKELNIALIRKGDTPQSLREFIEGKRGYETRWVDWNIPIHWGGMSDPFQPIELKERVSYECLKIFAETQYPFVVSTKGRLVAHPDYLDLLARCNCVVQISMVCSKYDKLEPGTPPYEERLEMAKVVASRVKRLMVRIQPYMPEVFRDVMANIPRLADAGVYGIVCEGMKFAKAKPGMVRIGGDSCYPIDVLKRDFLQIRQEAHRHGLRFFSGENRLRAMGDDMCCCGIEGLPGFKGNDYNLCMIANGKHPEPTENMKNIGTGGASRVCDRARAPPKRSPSNLFTA